MKFAKIGGIALFALAGILILALVTRSYFYEAAGSHTPKISEVLTSQLIATTSQGGFLDKSAKGHPEITAPFLGNSAPDLELNDFDGKPVQLSSFRGKPVLLNFWATWCPPCRKEMPDLESFHEKYGDKIIILGINWNDDPPKARELLKEAHISYRNLIDDIGKAFVEYQLTAVPTSFWIDEHGIIRGIWNGAMDTDTMIAGFQKTTNSIGNVGDH
jgi:thiol-disulfide isomerase/thioredoxin